MPEHELPNMLLHGEPARLFPVLAETSKEGRALSILLASMAIVDDLSRTMLATVGQRMGVRTRVRTFTEVVPANMPGVIAGRPDGLLVVETGRRSWTALVEAKVRRTRLDAEQIEMYLKLAKANGIDAVVTVSNEFTAVPHHHPVQISRIPKGVGLFHWSWTSILTYAKVLLADKDVDDREQRFLLAELVRFLDADSTGVMRFSRMDGNWKDIVGSVVSGAPLSDADAVTDTVANWHQQCRDLALRLMEEVNSKVSIRLPRAHLNDPQRRLSDDAEKLRKDAMLDVEFVVPDAAAPIKVEADLRARSIHVHMTINAPRDRKSARARTNWVLRQLASSKPDDLHVKADYPNRRYDPQDNLAAVRMDPDVLRHDNGSLSPAAFEVRMVRDAGHRFAGAATFVKEVDETVLRFYAQVGQRLKNWQPTAPKMAAPPEGATEETGDTDTAQITD